MRAPKRTAHRVLATVQWVSVGIYLLVLALFPVRGFEVTLVHGPIVWATIFLVAAAVGWAGFACLHPSGLGPVNVVAFCAAILAILAAPLIRYPLPFGQSDTLAHVGHSLDLLKGETNLVDQEWGYHATVAIVSRGAGLGPGSIITPLAVHTIFIGVMIVGLSAYRINKNVGLALLCSTCAATFAAFDLLAYYYGMVLAACFVFIAHKRGRLVLLTCFGAALTVVHIFPVLVVLCGGGLALAYWRLARLPRQAIQQWPTGLVVTLFSFLLWIMILTFVGAHLIELVAAASSAGLEAGVGGGIPKGVWIVQNIEKFNRIVIAEPVALCAVTAFAASIAIRIRGRTPFPQVAMVERFGFTLAFLAASLLIVASIVLDLILRRSIVNPVRFFEAASIFLGPAIAFAIIHLMTRPRLRLPAVAMLAVFSMIALVFFHPPAWKTVNGQNDQADVELTQWYLEHERPLRTISGIHFAALTSSEVGYNRGDEFLHRSIDETVRFTAVNVTQVPHFFRGSTPGVVVVVTSFDQFFWANKYQLKRDRLNQLDAFAPAQIYNSGEWHRVFQ